MKFTEKLAICYMCCGPTYRKTALEKLSNLYFDHPNLYYCILTDDKSYFKDLKRENLIVNELKDFYSEYPEIEIYEPFLESESVEDYAKKFIEQNYKFPFSTTRFHLLQAKQFNVHNVAMLCTDADLNFDEITDEIFQSKNTLYNYVSQWYKSITEENMTLVADILKEKYNLYPKEQVLVFDAAFRLFTFDSIGKMDQFFNVWNDVVLTLYREDKIKAFGGWYAVNEEYIIAPIYDVMGIKPPFDLDRYVRLCNLKHNPQEERFWLYNK